MPGGPWNDATDRKLLLTIIHLSTPQLPKWDRVATLMGNGYTAESTRQHFQKLRKDSKAQLGDPSSIAPASAGKGTPRKPKATKANGGEIPSKSSAGKRKAKNHAEIEHDDEEGSPSKKVKAEEEGGDFELS